MSETITQFVDNLKSSDNKAENIQGKLAQAAIDEASLLTRIQLDSIKVRDLSGENASGLFYTRSKKIEADTSLLEKGTKDQIIRVLTHEQTHKESDKNGQGVQYEEIGKVKGLTIEEGLTELVAAKKDGNAPESYEAERNQVISLVNKTNISVERALDLHLNDKNKLIEEFLNISPEKLN